jgi:hypothetical protein
LGEQDDTRLAGIAHGVSGDFVAVGGLGYLFAPEEQPSRLNRAAHRSQRSSAYPLACKDLIVSAARLEGSMSCKECIDAPNG